MVSATPEVILTSAVVPTATGSTKGAASGSSATHVNIVDIEMAVDKLKPIDIVDIADGPMINPESARGDGVAPEVPEANEVAPNKVGNRRKTPPWETTPSLIGATGTTPNNNITTPNITTPNITTPNITTPNNITTPDVSHTVPGKVVCGRYETHLEYWDCEDEAFWERYDGYLLHRLSVDIIEQKKKTQKIIMIQ
jgi:hypothetical protein